MTDLAIRLAEKVRQLRLRAGLTQAELAARAGVTVETIARLERVVRGRVSANSNPSLDTMARISSALGIAVADLLAEPSKRRPRADRLGTILHGATPATRRRAIRVVEALLQEEIGEAKAARRRWPS